MNTDLEIKVQDAINRAHGGFLSGNVTEAAIRAVLEWEAEFWEAKPGESYKATLQDLAALKREAGL